MRAVSRITRIIAQATLLTAFAVSLSSCSSPEEAQQKADQFKAEAQELYDEYYSKAHGEIADGKVDISPYTDLRDQVQIDCQQFREKLATCKEQAEADALFQAQKDYTAENDSMRQQVQKRVEEDRSASLIKKYELKSKRLEDGTKKEAQDLLDLYLTEHPSSSEDEEVKVVELTISEGTDKIKSIRRGLKGGKSKLDAAYTEIDTLHEAVKELLAQRENAYKGWVPPPPAPEQPEKILFTIETTPALYKKLLIPLTQQYKNFTLVYVGEKTGNHCIADAQNKEGVVFRIVEPGNLQTSMDKVAQGQCDAVIAFRDAFPAVSYSEFEDKAAADDNDLNSVIVSGLAYNALVFKSSASYAQTNLTTSGLINELAGSKIYVGAEGTLDKELFDTILKDTSLNAQSVESPVNQAMSSSDSLAIVAFTRTEDNSKKLRIARTPCKENVYFLPTKGNIAAGRYTYNASANAVLNPLSPGNDEIRKFLAFILSDEGQNAVRAADFISRDEYDEDNPEVMMLRKLFKDKGFTIGRIISYDTFLFPKNDAHITKNPRVTNRKAEFSAFDSTIRSNFGHIADVLRNAKCRNQDGIIAVGIIGHASSEGGHKVNKPLSVNRAKYSASCIKEQQVKVSMLLTEGMSSDVPVDSNDDESGRIRNRRATAYVLEVFEIGMKK